MTSQILTLLLDAARVPRQLWCFAGPQHCLHRGWTAEVTYSRPWSFSSSPTNWVSSLCASSATSHDFVGIVQRETLVEDVASSRVFANSLATRADAERPRKRNMSIVKRKRRALCWLVRQSGRSEWMCKCEESVVRSESVYQCKRFDAGVVLCEPVLFQRVT